MDTPKTHQVEIKIEEKPDIKMEEKVTKLGESKKPYKRKKGQGHVIPPSDATHPKDRWDMYYVYMFIRRFTNLTDEIPGFLCVEDLENALLDEPGKANYLLEQVILRFILNLRPNTRNTSSDLIPSTLFSVLHEFWKDNGRQRERTVFWDWDADTNIMPLKDTDGGWWFADWDLKLRILRQLVDWQLMYSARVKDIIDTAWQVRQKPHKKQAENPKPPPEAGTPGSREILAVIPLGQDKERTRFWIADDSPRLYTSTNPWKITQIFKCVATTLNEYTDQIEKLRSEAPPEPEDGVVADQKHHLHWNLIYAMEERVDEVINEIKRMEDVRKRLAAEEEEERNATGPRRSKVRPRITDLENEEDRTMDFTLGFEAMEGIEHTESAAEVPPTRNSSPPTSNRDMHDDLIVEIINPKDEDYGYDDAEIDELQDDSSLNAGSDEENGQRKGGKGKKRRRRSTPPKEKPSRISARKKPRREEPNTPERVAPNGVHAKSNGFTTSTPPILSPKETPLVTAAALVPTVIPASETTKARPPTAPGLKAAKGQNTKYWFYDEDDGIPKKKPPMMDDPDALLRRRKKQAKAEAAAAAAAIAAASSNPAFPSSDA